MYLNKIKTTISFFLILSVISINKFAFAEIIKPNNGIEPLQVVKIQLRGLKNNSKEYKDDGIEQTWAFAHPDNQRYTGPLEKFNDEGPLKDCWLSTAVSSPISMGSSI